MSDLWALKDLTEEGIPIVASYYFTSISMSKASIIYMKQDLNNFWLQVLSHILNDKKVVLTLFIIKKNIKGLCFV